MNVLQIIQFFSPIFGGPVSSVYNLSSELSRIGHDVTILTTDFKFDQEYAKTLQDRVNVIPFKCKYNLASFLYSPSMEKWMKSNLNNYQVVHMHNARTYQNILAHKYSKAYNIPYILQPRGSAPPFFQKKTLKKIHDFFWGNKIIEDAEKIIASTQFEKDYFTDIGVNNNKIEIIPNGIDLDYYRLQPKKGVFKEKNNIKENEKIILYLGRIHKIKGIDLLIKAFYGLLNHFDDLKLCIVGVDDGFLKNIKRLIKEFEIEDKVHLTGPLYGNDKLEAYVDADVYVLPSLYESFGNTVIEAAACGTPVIVTEECAIKHFVKDSFGFVVERDINKLQNILYSILINTEKCAELGEKAREYVQIFDNKTIAKSFEDLYYDIT